MKTFRPSCLAGLAAVICGLSNSALAAPADQATAATSRVYIEYQSQKAEVVRRAIEQGQGVVHHSFDNLHAFSATLPDKAIEALSKRQDVVLIEEDPKRYPMSETTPYGVQMVQAPQVWAGSGAVPSVTGAGIEVCVIDSGIDAAHPDFAGVPLSGDLSPDTCGHGTHVSGTIAAAANNLGVVGVSPNTSLHVVKVFDGPSCGWSYSSDLVAAARECADRGSDIISMSLGGSLKSRTEERAFQAYYDAGMLSVAAAGNDGNTRKSYPASYTSVISVAAVDAAKQVADFSQQNDQVELAALGVAVLSTVPKGTGLSAGVSAGGSGYDAIAMDGSPEGNVSGSLVDCGLGDNFCSGATGKVCLIQRGSVTFADKVLNCEDGGGIAAIIYNNEPGALSGTLGGEVTTIPSVGISDTDGTALLGMIGSTAGVTITADDYASWDGTSMATPHVSGVAALLWSAHPTATNAEIRAAMQNTAEDLGAAGKDNAYGFGLVQANDALASMGGEVSSNHPPQAAFEAICAEGTCTFSNGSTDEDGDALTYAWSFGDGNTSIAQNPSHLYSCDKSYSVTLTVTDTSGASASHNATVTPGGAACPVAEPLVISNVSSGKLKGVKFEITWSTDRPADSTVTFACCGTFDNSTMTTSHSMSFNGSKGATYEYYVTSTDADGNTDTEGPFTHNN